MKDLCSKVNLSTSFHPQIGSQVNHTIQTLKDMLKVVSLSLKIIEMITCLLLFLHIIIAIIGASK